MDDIYQFLDKMLTAKQQAALLVITVGVSSLTQAFKNIYFGFHPVRSKPRKRAIIWSVALILGLLGGYAGYALQITPQPLWFWIFSGITSVGGSIGLFHVIAWIFKKK